MWLSGTPADDDLLRVRAQQAGFAADSLFAVAVFRASSASGQSQSLEGLASLARDDMSRRQIKGAVGTYVDSIVALYPVDEADSASLTRLRATVESLRGQLAARSPRGQVSAGISPRGCRLVRLARRLPRGKGRHRHRP